jgi:hypothetical protein
MSYSRLLNSGEERIRTFEDISQQIYSLSQLAALVLPQLVLFVGGPTLKPFNISQERLKSPVFGGAFEKESAKLYGFLV